MGMGKVSRNVSNGFCRDSNLQGEFGNGRFLPSSSYSEVASSEII